MDISISSHAGASARDDFAVSRTVRNVSLRLSVRLFVQPDMSNFIAQQGEFIVVPSGEL